MADPAVAVTGASLVLLTPAVFLAGVLSFFSPCTLPILPAYFAFTFQARRGSVVLMTLAFFLGLATTLSLLGASATALGRLVFQNLSQITFWGGVIVMALGVASLLGKGIAGPRLQERPVATVAGSYLYGLTFALGWSACIGPILGSVLTLLATQGAGAVQGAFLAVVYAMGLGLPLILISVLFSRVGHGSRFWTFIRGRGFEVNLGLLRLHLHTTGLLTGLLLIGMGYLLASGQLTALTQEAAGSSLSLWVIDAEENLRTLFGLR